MEIQEVKAKINTERKVPMVMKIQKDISIIANEIQTLYKVNDIVTKN
jgi:hypothetical protein